MRNLERKLICWYAPSFPNIAAPAIVDLDYVQDSGSNGGRRVITGSLFLACDWDTLEAQRLK